MKRIILSIIAVIFVVSLTACGSANQPVNAAEQVRLTEGKALAAITGEHPEDACQFYTVGSHDSCLQGAMMAKLMHVKTSSIYPSGWEKRLARAKVIVHGDTATVSSIMGTKKVTKFAKVDGHWLITT
jgi:hypothetical protein